MPRRPTKKKDKINIPYLPYQEVKNLEADFRTELETNPIYSLEIDPKNVYHFSSLEREFIQNMIQFKSVKFVSIALMNLEIADGLEIYNKYAVQEEIKRINLAMYARRFCSKMADLDALGGYLTTAITDDYVAEADRLTAKEKLAAVKMLIDLNELKSKALQNPEIIDMVAIENDIKSLKVDDIKMLIENTDENDKMIQEKNELIAKIDADGLLTPEEVTYLRTLRIDELKKITKEIDGGNQNESNERSQDESES